MKLCQEDKYVELVRTYDTYEKQNDSESVSPPSQNDAKVSLSQQSLCRALANIHGIEACPAVEQFKGPV